ncbi:MAG: hypothetical protein IKH51_06845 [Clostridia bacterium]|nr:hypothetical protein [Clostridia bacterium]
MKKKKKRVPLSRDELFAGAVSANECTGLIAKIPTDESEAESYRDLVDVPVTSKKPERRKDGR